MDSNKEKIVRYDIRGQICPSSLLTTLREINTLKKELSQGIINIHILTDNRDATVTIPDATENMGYLAEVIKQEGYYLIKISKI